MSVRPLWIGIDQGYSQMGLAAVDARGDILAAERTRDPHGDGHDRDVALARLRCLLERVAGLRTAPVHLAGYCYDRSGVAKAFTQAGWTVAGRKALNDVVGVYGLTPMRGHAVVAGCGTFSQVVYVDYRQSVRWPGPDVAGQLPEWPLSGGAYAAFVVDQARQAPTSTLALRVREILGGASGPAPHHHAQLGPLLSGMLDDPAARAYLTRAAAAVVETRNVLSRRLPCARPCDVVMGGGAVRDDRLWALLDDRWRALGVPVHRVEGEPAVGLARYALSHPDADPWAFVGDLPPDWLSP